MRTGSHVNALFKGDHEREYAWFSSVAGFPLLSTSADHAARRIVDACRHGDRSLTITLPAKLAEAMNGLAPGFVGSVMELAGRLLPDPFPGGERTQTGRQSRSFLSPNPLSRPADAQIERNNEARAR